MLLFFLVILVLLCLSLEDVFLFPREGVDLKTVQWGLDNFSSVRGEREVWEAFL